MTIRTLYWKASSDKKYIQSAFNFWYHAYGCKGISALVSLPSFEYVGMAIRAVSNLCSIIFIGFPNKFACRALITWAW